MRTRTDFMPHRKGLSPTRLARSQFDGEHQTGLFCWPRSRWKTWLKAFLVHQHPHYVEGARLSREHLNGHDLSKLQSKCKNIPAPKRTRHVFETLGVGVNSWARYPCSTSIERESEERALTPEFW